MSEESTKPTDRIDVSYVAHLARLSLTEDEQRLFQEQLEHIVDYVRKIGELDVAGIEPTSHAHPVHNVYREDTVRPGLDSDQVLENGPEVADNQFIVPRIVE